MRLSAASDNPTHELAAVPAVERLVLLVPPALALLWRQPLVIIHPLQASPTSLPSPTPLDSLPLLRPVS